VLKLHAPIFQLMASFCDGNGTSSLVNSQTGKIVPLGNISFSFKSQDVAVACGNIQELRRMGCSEILLKQSTRYWLEIDAGSGFHKVAGHLCQKYLS
jgi:hypothetical protein